VSRVNSVAVTATDTTGFAAMSLIAAVLRATTQFVLVTQSVLEALIASNCNFVTATVRFGPFDPITVLPVSGTDDVADVVLSCSVNNPVLSVLFLKTSENESESPPAFRSKSKSTSSGAVPSTTKEAAT